MRMPIALGVALAAVFVSNSFGLGGDNVAGSIPLTSVPTFSTEKIVRQGDSLEPGTPEAGANPLYNSNNKVAFEFRFRILVAGEDTAIQSRSLYGICFSSQVQDCFNPQ